MIYGILRKRMYKDEPMMLRCWKIEIQVSIGFYRYPSGNLQSSSRKRTSDAKPSAAASARKRKPSKTAWRYVGMSVAPTKHNGRKDGRYDMPYIRMKTP